MCFSKVKILIGGVMNEWKYKKQVELKKATQERAEKLREAREERKLQGCTFAPEFYSVPMKDFKEGGGVLSDKYR